MSLMKWNAMKNGVKKMFLNEIWIEVSKPLKHMHMHMHINVLLIVVFRNGKTFTYTYAYVYVYTQFS